MPSFLATVQSFFTNGPTSSSAPRSSRAQRQQSLSYTHSAFQVPSDFRASFSRPPSPTFPGPSFTSPAGQTSRGGGGAYAPPPAPSSSRYSAYGAGSPHPAYAAPENPRRASAVPLAPHSPALHPFPPPAPYPPLQHTWARIARWCSDEFPELYETLNYPATIMALDALEDMIGFQLPPAVRESYLIHDGQEIESGGDGLFFGLHLLSLDEVASEYGFWREVDRDPTTGLNPNVIARMASVPSGWILPAYSHRGWLPLATDRMGNYLGVDLEPPRDGGGSPGQVIIFGRDYDRKVVVWRGDSSGGWGRFLATYAEDLESGEWDLTSGSPGSSASEDSVGHLDYFGNERGSKIELRIGGEYRGWDVLEAWADRSERRWTEIGLGREVGETPRLELQSPPEDGEPSRPIEGLGIASTSSPPLMEPAAEDEGAAPAPALASSRPPSSKGKERADTNLLPHPLASPPMHPSAPPPPASPLALPTLEDVKASEAISDFETTRKGSGSWILPSHSDHVSPSTSPRPSGEGTPPLSLGSASSTTTSNSAAHPPPRSLVIEIPESPAKGILAVNDEPSSAQVLLSSPSQRPSIDGGATFTNGVAPAEPPVVDDDDDDARTPTVRLVPVPDADAAPSASAEAEAEAVPPAAAAGPDIAREGSPIEAAHADGMEEISLARVSLSDDVPATGAAAATDKQAKRRSVFDMVKWPGGKKGPVDTPPV